MQPDTKINLLGIYLLFFLLALMIIPLITYYSNIESTLIKSLVYIGSSGGIGGTIFCSRSFHAHVSANDFDLNRTWWYIIRPVNSIVIGIFIYFFIAGGLRNLGVVSDVSYSKGVMFYSSISFLAGYAFTQFIAKLEKFAEKFL